MIDENLNPWLIEINMSPSMEYSTPVTKKLVKMVLQDTAKLIATTKKANEIGLWKCIYKGDDDIKKFSKYNIV
jgi:tubulin monoglycylase TTLL3/8